MMNSLNGDKNTSDKYIEATDYGKHPFKLICFHLGNYYNNYIVSIDISSEEYSFGFEDSIESNW